jgi:hypothetical protein
MDRLKPNLRPIWAFNLAVAYAVVQSRHRNRLAQYKHITKGQEDLRQANRTMAALRLQIEELQVCDLSSVRNRVFQQQCSHVAEYT